MSCVQLLLLFFHWIIDCLWSRLCHKTISGCHPVTSFWNQDSIEQVWGPAGLQPANTKVECVEKRRGKPRCSDFLVFLELWLVWDGRVSHGQCQCKLPWPWGRKALGEYGCMLLQEELMSSHVSHLRLHGSTKIRGSFKTRIKVLLNQQPWLILLQYTLHTHCNRSCFRHYMFLFPVSTFL